MFLTELQKNITKDILEGKIKDVKSFFLNYCSYDIDKNKHGNFGHGFAEKLFKPNINIYFPKDQSDTENLLKEFVALFQLLSRNGLIFTISNPEKGKEILPIFRKHDGDPPIKPNERVLTLIKELYWEEIIVSDDLKKFVSRDFKTENEYFRKQEIISREKAQKLTRNVAYASISASVLVTLIVVLFNYLTYSNERVVTIKNSEIFSDTIKVELINDDALIKQVKLEFDSLKSDTSSF